MEHERSQNHWRCDNSLVGIWYSWLQPEAIVFLRQPHTTGYRVTKSRQRSTDRCIGRPEPIQSNGTLSIHRGIEASKHRKLTQSSIHTVSYRRSLYYYYRKYVHLFWLFGIRKSALQSPGPTLAHAPAPDPNGKKRGQTKRSSPI